MNANGGIIFLTESVWNVDPLKDVLLAQVETNVQAVPMGTI